MHARQSMYGMMISLDNLTINIATKAEQLSENGMYTHENVHVRKESYIQIDQEDNSTFLPLELQVQPLHHRNGGIISKTKLHLLRMRLY